MANLRQAQALWSAEGTADYRITVTRFGFPRRIDYDGDEMIADDEFQYELTDFRAGGAD